MSKKNLTLAHDTPTNLERERALAKEYARIDSLTPDELKRELKSHKVDPVRANTPNGTQFANLDVHSQSDIAVSAASPGERLKMTFWTSMHWSEKLGLYGGTFLFMCFAIFALVI